MASAPHPDFPDWVKLAGYRHETVHTGVLQHMLRGELGTAVAELFFDLEPGSVRRWEPDRKGCFDEGGPWTEVPVAKTGKRADLGGWLALTSSDRPTTWVLVETKVDSAGSRPQLDATAAAADQSVLFALGTAALAWDQPLLDAEVEAGLLTMPGQGNNPAPINGVADKARRGWRFVGPGEWAGILRTVGAERHQTLVPYIASIEQQARAHSDAASAVADGWLPKPSASDWRASVERHAWCAAVRTELMAQPIEPGGTLSGGHWNALTENDATGTWLRIYPPGWTGGKEADVSLQLRLNSKGAPPRLALVFGGGAAKVTKARTEGALTAVADHFGLRPGQSREQLGDTYIAASLTLEGPDSQPAQVANTTAEVAWAIGETLAISA